MLIYSVLGNPSHDANTGPRVVGASMKKLYLCVWKGGDTLTSGGDPRNVARALGTGRVRKPVRILLSYHYYRDEDLGSLLATCFDGVEIDVFADSGAWSAFSIGKAIIEAEYIAWVERWKHLFTAVAGPDIIGDAASTCAATERMLARGLGLPVLPVFHVGEDWSYLTRYAAMSDYIALGGMVPLSRERDTLLAWCTKAFSLLTEEVRTHGFGMTTWPIMLGFPWYSVDSSSWTSAFRYATLQLFDSRRGAFVTINMRDTKELLRSAPILAAYGLRPSDAKAKGYDRDLICAVSVESWQRAEEWITSRRGASVRTYLAAGAHAAGPNATSGAGDVRTLAAGVNAARARKSSGP